MIHYFYGTLQVGIGQTLCSFEHVSCLIKKVAQYCSITYPVYQKHQYEKYLWQK